jgi:uncharacterized protein (TIRG00374 family)
MKKIVIRLVLPLVLTLGFLYFFFRKVEWKEVLRYLTDVNPFFFALLFLLVPLHLATRSIRWYFLLKHEKKNVKFFSMFAANAVGFTVTFIFPGRLGEIVKPLYLAQKEGMRKGFVVGTIVVERVFDLFAMCFLLGVFLLAKPLYSSFFQLNQEASKNLYFWGKVGVILATGILLVSLSLYFFKEKTLRVVSFLLKPLPARFSQKVISLSEEFIEGLKFFHSAGNVLIFAALSILVWCGIMFYYWVFFFAYRISLPYFILVPYVFVCMVGASIPTPGMAGGFHAFSKFGLTSFYHIDANLAVGMTIVVHAVQLLMTCLIGYVILWKEGLSLFQLRKLGEGEEP